MKGVGPIDFKVDDVRAKFESTRWSVVLAAGRAADDHSAVESHRALEMLCGIYWYPLYAFARRRGASPQSAEDITQSFFVRLLEKDYLRSADPDRGRFRSFLLTMFKRFMLSESQRDNAVKRGGGLRHLSLDFSFGEQLYGTEPEDRWPPEKLYQRRWALTLLDRVLDQLREAYSKKGKANFFEHAHVFLTGRSDEHRYSDIAAKLNVTPGNLRVGVHRLRNDYREMLAAEITQTLEDPDDLESEFIHLKAAIRGDL